MSNSYTIRYLRPGSTVWELSTVDWSSKTDALLVASIWHERWPDETHEVVDSKERKKAKR